MGILPKGKPAWVSQGHQMRFWFLASPGGLKLFSSSRDSDRKRRTAFANLARNLPRSRSHGSHRPHPHDFDNGSPAFRRRSNHDWLIIFSYGTNMAEILDGVARQTHKIVQAKSRQKPLISGAFRVINPYNANDGLNQQTPGDFPAGWLIRHQVFMRSGSEHKTRYSRFSKMPCSFWNKRSFLFSFHSSLGHFA
jgi:hypothetical protein